MNFTESQQKAIDEKKTNILVSAAAGSGKTTVLCERIKRRIIAGECDISRLLITSFNNESANDLKKKLSRVLSEEYEKTGDKRILRQSLLVDTAAISTIHSFALSILRDNFNKLSLPAGFSVASENDMDVLKNSLMNDVITEFYDSDKDFGALTDNLIIDRDDELASIFLSIYTKLMNEPSGLSLIVENDELMKCSIENFDNSKWNLVFRASTQMRLEYYSLFFRAESDNCEDYGKSCAKSFYTAAANLADELLSLESDSDMRHYIEKNPLEKFNKNKNDIVSEYCKSAAKDFRDYLNGLLKQNDYDNRDDIEKTIFYNECIYRLLFEFDRRFAEKKRTMGVVDYTDMERMAHGLLVGKDKKPTQTALYYRDCFDEVYVDEYQDTNALQDEIFRAVSHGNLFVVGDIKQSIYGFRGACPNIFSRYRLHGFGDEEGTRIFLSDNFRSDENILKFSNAIFSGIMRCVPSVGYMREDDLNFRKDTKDAPEKVEFSVFSKKDAESEGKNTDEMRYVASRIRKLLDSGVEPEDIAILSRNLSETVLEKIMPAMEEYGICVHTKSDSDFFSKPAVLLMLCLLNCVNNQRKDIYLAGLLHSGIIGITTDELVGMSLYHKGECLYDTVSAYYDDEENKNTKAWEKINKFFALMKRIHALESDLPLDELVRQIIDTSDIVNILGMGVSDSARREAQSNVFIIYSMARELTARSGSGLSYFISYLDNIREAGMKSDGYSDGTPGVRLMTIHTSKGIEFKYCFVVGMGGRFRLGEKTDMRRRMPVMFDRDLGIAIAIPSDEYIGDKHDSIITKAIEKKHENEIIDEEMRLLYVAFTRAKHKLFVTGSFDARSSGKAIIERYSGREGDLQPYECYSAGNFLDWLLLCLGDIPSDCFEMLQNPDIEVIPHSGDGEKKEEKAEEETDFSRLELLNIDYKYKEQAKIPAKLSVSKLTPDVLDSADDFSATLPVKDGENDGDEKILLPSFMSEEKRALGSDIGTATHEFMQFCDFAMLEQNGVEGEIARLVEKRYISPEKAALVSRRGIAGFLKSTLFADIKAAKKVYREQRFNIRLPASNFTMDKEKADLLKDEYVLVQGVIDCIFINEKGDIILCDYKTDNFKGINDEEKICRELKERYTEQLSYYKTAVIRIFGKAPATTCIYSFALGKSVIL